MCKILYISASSFNTILLMKSLVTGLSASKYFSTEYDLTIGVNDCPFPTDHLIICDHPRVFSHERLQIIQDHPGWLFTHIREWMQLRQAELIALTKDRSDVSNLESDRYQHSISSPFIACVHAFKSGATEIHLAGVDLNGHPHLGQDHNIKKCQIDFGNLAAEMKKHGCKLGLIRSLPNGALMPVLPRMDGFELVWPQ